jgi:hypothetical protein
MQKSRKAELRTTVTLFIYLISELLLYFYFEMLSKVPLTVVYSRGERTNRLKGDILLYEYLRTSAPCFDSVNFSK